MTKADSGETLMSVPPGHVLLTGYVHPSTADENGGQWEDSVAENKTIAISRDG